MELFSIRIQRTFQLVSTYNMAHSTFSSWKDMGMSYVIGRSLWGGKHAYNSVMKDTADELLKHENSPWRKYAW